MGQNWTSYKRNEFLLKSYHIVAILRRCALFEENFTMENALVVEKEPITLVGVQNLTENY